MGRGLVALALVAACRRPSTARASDAAPSRPDAARIVTVVPDAGPRCTIDHASVRHRSKHGIRTRSVTVDCTPAPRVELDEGELDQGSERWGAAVPLAGWEKIAQRIVPLEQASLACPPPDETLGEAQVVIETDHVELACADDERLPASIEQLAESIELAGALVPESAREAARVAVAEQARQALFDHAADAAARFNRATDPVKALHELMQGVTTVSLDDERLDDSGDAGLARDAAIADAARDLHAGGGLLCHEAVCTGLGATGRRYELDFGDDDPRGFALFTIRIRHSR